nr:uncharacterized protein LOC129382801 [Dermacentor andersoni]
MQSLKIPILLFVQFIARSGTWLQPSDPAITGCPSPALLTVPIFNNASSCHQFCFTGHIPSMVSGSTTLLATAATQEDITALEILRPFSGHGGAAAMQSLKIPILLFVQFIARSGTWLQPSDPAITGCPSPALLTVPIFNNASSCHQFCFTGHIPSMVSGSTTLLATAATQEDITALEILRPFSGHGGTAAMQSLKIPILLFVQKQCFPMCQACDCLLKPATLVSAACCGGPRKP